MRSFARVAFLAFPVLTVSAVAHAAAPSAEPVVWSVEVTPDGAVSAAELEKAAGALRAGVRAAGGIVGADAKSSQKHLVASLSESGDEFVLRVSAAGEPTAGASGAAVLLEDGAKRAALHVAARTGAIAVPPDAHAEWFVDGRRVVPEGGMTLTVPKGTHVVRAVVGGASAMAMLDVAGGETTPFPKFVLGTLAAPTAVAAAGSGNATHGSGTPHPPGEAPRAEKRRISPWIWIGSGVVAVAAAGAVAVASQGSKSSTEVTKSGPGSTTVGINIQ